MEITIVHKPKNLLPVSHVYPGKKIVLGGDDCEPFQLFSGQYRYKFQVNLASGLPSSYSGKNGFIRYEVLVTIRRPWSDDNVFRQPFTVTKKVDLNLSPFYKNPILEEELKLFWCGLCDTDPLKVQIVIPLSAYACGQKIPFTVNVTNESNVNCHDSSIKLQQIVKTTCKVPYERTRRSIVNIVKKQLGKIGSKSNREFSGYLQLPSNVIPTCQTACNIIEIAYSIQVIFYTNSCHRNFAMAFPITIGTIPLNESLPNFNNVVTKQPTISKFIFSDLHNSTTITDKPSPTAPPLLDNNNKEPATAPFSSVFNSLIGMKPIKISDSSQDNIKNAHKKQNK